MKSTIVLVAALGLAACSSPPAPTSRPAPAKPYLRVGSAPGFDKRDFPGLEPMAVWMRESPFVWVAYYLPAPCYAGAAWSGQRAALEGQGWGLAVLFVGQQAPGATPNATAGRMAAPDCGRMPLGRAQGEKDGANAVSLAAEDGFPLGSTLFLDVERADPLPPALTDYVRGWISSVLAAGYIGGLYAHKLNAERLSEVQREAFTAASNSALPPFWVANSVGFELGRSPSESGYGFATIWQTPTDSTETWGGVRFRIDRNVASVRNPSAPR